MDETLPFPSCDYIMLHSFRAMSWCLAQVHLFLEIGNNLCSLIFMACLFLYACIQKRGTKTNK